MKNIYYMLIKILVLNIVNINPLSVRPFPPKFTLLIYNYRTRYQMH
jgi:hypothetical protein